MKSYYILLPLACSIASAYGTTLPMQNNPSTSMSTSSAVQSNTNKPGAVKATVARAITQKKKQIELGEIPTKPMIVGHTSNQKIGTDNSLFSKVFGGNLAAILQVGAVVANETGHDNAAKYLLGAGAIAGAAEVTQDVINGTVDASTVAKGVGSAAALYGATSGNAQDLQNFSRGSAILTATGAIASGDGLLGTMNKIEYNNETIYTSQKPINTSNVGIATTFQKWSDNDMSGIRSEYNQKTIDTLSQQLGGYHPAFDQTTSQARVSTIESAIKAGGEGDAASKLVEWANTDGYTVVYTNPQLGEVVHNSTTSPVSFDVLAHNLSPYSMVVKDPSSNGVFVVRSDALNTTNVKNSSDFKTLINAEVARQKSSGQTAMTAEDIKQKGIKNLLGYF